MMDEADYIVVGTGSAGSVVAARLCEDPGARVLAIEAGGWDREISYRLPLLGGKMYSYRRNNWYYSSVNQTYAGGRKIFLPRGRLVGGTFNMNGIVYMRGHRADFDNWAQMGNAGWSYAEVLPYFKRSERYHGEANAFHGTEGGLDVAPCQEPNPTSRLWVKAGAQAGHPRNPDPNGAEQEGFSLNQHNVWNGRRVTTARAFLHPAAKTGRLKVLTRCHVLRVLIENGGATGVEVVVNGVRKMIRTRREVVLCCGAMNTPKLLMLSGIGPGAHLSRMGVNVLHDMPGVGENLQDHYNVTVTHSLTRPISLARDLRLDRLLWHLARGILARRGPVSISPIEAGALLRIDPLEEAPDVQVAFTSIDPLQARVWAPGLSRPPQHSVGACLWPNRPHSRGTVTLASADPRDAPVIDPAFLSDPRDLELTRRAIGVVREVFRQDAWAGVLGPETAPGAEVTADDDLARFIRQAGGSGHHACGTARMGMDERAVVDPQLKVRGIANLRVADASVMPMMVSGNTNASVIMIGEKAADLIRGRTLPAEYDVGHIAAE